MLYSLKTTWNSFNIMTDLINKHEQNTEKSNTTKRFSYYIINIPLYGSILNFNSNKALDCYIKMCLCYQKVNCLKNLFETYINKVINSKETFSTYEEFIKFNLYNNPYAHYFIILKNRIMYHNRLNSNMGESFDNYNRRCINDKYQQCYIIKENNKLSNDNVINLNNQMIIYKDREK